MKEKKMWLYLVMGFIILFLISAVVFFLFQNYKNGFKSYIREEVYLEYGHALTEKDIFVHFPEKTYSFSIPLEEIVEVGDYNITVTIQNHDIPCIIHIIDSTSPILEVHPITRYLDEVSPQTEDFVTSCEDLSHCIFKPLTFEKVEGTQNITITAYDDYGNKTSKETQLTFLVDLDAPVFEGLSPLTVFQGNKPDLRKNVRAIDARFGEINFSVDDSQVNYNQPGVYMIFYSASDMIGNKSNQTRQITIKQKEQTYMISNFPTSSQYPLYPNGCEMMALYNLLRFYHISVTPEQLVSALPKGSGPFWKDGILYGGNPEVEFVGDPRDIHGYGVFQKPIIQLANQFKAGIIDYTGHSLQDVLKLVKQQIPVQVWASIGMKNTGVCASWTHPSTNKQIDWICNLHSVVIVGYNSSTIYVSDSFTGKIENYSYQQFEKMYNLFGKRAIYFPN